MSGYSWDFTKYSLLEKVFNTIKESSQAESFQKDVAQVLQAWAGTSGQPPIKEIWLVAFNRGLPATIDFLHAHHATCWDEQAFLLEAIPYLRCETSEVYFSQHALPKISEASLGKALLIACRQLRGNLTIKLLLDRVEQLKRTDLILEPDSNGKSCLLAAVSQNNLFVIEQVAERFPDIFQQFCLNFNWGNMTDGVSDKRYDAILALLIVGRDHKVLEFCREHFLAGTPGIYSALGTALSSNYIQTVQALIRIVEVFLCEEQYQKYTNGLYINLFEQACWGLKGDRGLEGGATVILACLVFDEKHAQTQGYKPVCDFKSSLFQRVTESCPSTKLRRLANELKGATISWESKEEEMRFRWIEPITSAIARGEWHLMILWCRLAHLNHMRAPEMEVIQEITRCLLTHETTLSPVMIEQFLKGLLMHSLSVFAELVKVSLNSPDEANPMKAAVLRLFNSQDPRMMVASVETESEVTPDAPSSAKTEQSDEIKALIYQKAARQKMQACKEFDQLKEAMAKIVALFLKENSQESIAALDALNPVLLSPSSLLEVYAQHGAVEQTRTLLQKERFPREVIGRAILAGLTSKDNRAFLPITQLLLEYFHFPEQAGSQKKEIFIMLVKHAVQVGSLIKKTAFVNEEWKAMIETLKQQVDAEAFSKEEMSPKVKTLIFGTGQVTAGKKVDLVSYDNDCNF